MDELPEPLVIQHYRILRRLGAGGMGDVYLASDTRLQREVAIKFLRPTPDGLPDLKQRVLREARAAAALDHPNICPVFEIGLHDDQPFIVMPYVEGETLASCLRRGKLEPSVTLRIGEQLLSALHVAHSHGIVHRDIKPQNIIVMPNGQTKLLDFGVAKRASVLSATASTSTQAVDESTVGLVVGTPAYMAPEQAKGEGVDGRTDLFAVGAVLYECFTGQPAFLRGSVRETLDDTCHKEPPAPSRLVPALTRTHDHFCCRLMAKAPSDRFNNAHEALTAIQALPSARGVAVHLRSVKNWQWLVMATALLGTLAVYATRNPHAHSVPPPEAQVWLQRGTDALREGAYYSAAKAFDEGLRIFPDMPTAYARLAEARAELDDQAGSRNALLQLSQRYPDDARLDPADRLRVTAMRSLAQRHLEPAVAAYQQLVLLDPEDAGSWVDLGRAQVSAVQLQDARTSFEHALKVDAQFAAAYVQLASVEAFAGRSKEALASLDRAEQLYKTSSNVEGQTEVLIRRAVLLDRQGDYLDAKRSLESARDAAKTIQSPSHAIRAQLGLCNLLTSDGHFSEAVKCASAATDVAIDADLDSVAADGLIDLALALQLADKSEEGQRVVERASRLASRRGALRTEARAQTQLASLQQQDGKPAQALATLQQALDFFAVHHYLKFQLDALNIATRANRQLDRIAVARELSAKSLEIAERLQNDSQMADTLATLAALSTTAGDLKEALGYRQRAETIHRRQQDEAVLPYDLTNRAEVLALLGRTREASAALDEVEEGIARKVESFMGRRTRTLVLRALVATVTNEPARVLEYLEHVPPSPTLADPGTALADGLRNFALASISRLGRYEPIANGEDLAASYRRERQFWVALTHDRMRRNQAAFDAGASGLAALEAVDNPELEWRLAAICAISATTLGKASIATQMRERAARRLQQLRAAWGQDFDSYSNRPDLRALRIKAGLS